MAPLATSMLLPPPSPTIPSGLHIAHQRQAGVHILGARVLAHVGEALDLEPSSPQRGLGALDVAGGDDARDRVTIRARVISEPRRQFPEPVDRVHAEDEARGEREIEGPGAQLVTRLP